MKYIKGFEEVILESSIGSENIRNKYYSDIDKHIFYKIVNLDPTSIRKKDFSKPGKYTKWLLSQYKKNILSDQLLENDSFTKELKYYLLIFSTGWFKSKFKKEWKEIVYDDDGYEKEVSVSKDIYQYGLSEFVALLRKKVSGYEVETEKSKFDIVYSDSKVDILVPINFAASYETAKNTEWCSQQKSGFDMWNKMAILFRIIPKDNTYDKLKITWGRGEINKSWQIACSKYPEIMGYTSPFEVVDGVETWEKSKERKDKQDTTQKWIENSKEISKTMSLLSPEAKHYIEEFHKKNKI